METSPLVLSSSTVEEAMTCSEYKQFAGKRTTAYAAVASAIAHQPVGRTLSRNGSKRSRV